jgi:hypothetical protein
VHEHHLSQNPCVHGSIMQWTMCFFRKISMVSHQKVDTVIVFRASRKIYHPRWGSMEYRCHTRLPSAQCCHHETTAPLSCGPIKKRSTPSKASLRTTRQNIRNMYLLCPSHSVTLSFSWILPSCFKLWKHPLSRV